MSEKKRINWLLILQGWAMFWVVIGHSTLVIPGEGPIWDVLLMRFAYSFHMPLFMLVSGWLFYLTRITRSDDKDGGGKKWTYSAIIKDKALRLLLPGIFFSILSFAVKLAFPGEVSRQAGLSFHEIVHSYLYPYDNPMRELWFIVTLFWLFLFTPFWRLMHKNVWLEYGCLILILAVLFWNPEIELLCIGNVCEYAIWFYLGILISKEDYVERVFNKNVWLTMIAGIGVYILGHFTLPTITTVGGVVFSFGFALMADKYYPQLFYTFSKYTYQIFLMGIFAQIFIKIMYKHYGGSYTFMYLLCVLSGIYVPVLISIIAKKMAQRPLLLCLGLK